MRVAVSHAFAVAPRTRQSVRTRAFVGIIAACVFLVVGVAAVAVMIATQRFEVLFFVGTVILLALGSLVMRNGVRVLQFTQGKPEGPLSLVAPFAFELADDTVYFPALVGQPEQRWPLAQTTWSATDKVLTLSSPGHRTRRYFASVLAESPRTVAQGLDDYRASLAS